MQLQIVATLLSKLCPFVSSSDVHHKQRDCRFRAHEEARAYSAGHAGMSAANCPSLLDGKSPSSNSGLLVPRTKFLDSFLNLK